MREYHFGSGRPDPASFPAEALAETARRVIAREGAGLVNYPDGKGHLALREIAAERYARDQGVPVSIDEITLTSGSMQALELITDAFVRPGEVIVTEAYTYAGSLGVFRSRDAQLAGVPLDDQGMRMDALEATLARLDRAGTPPKFIYTIASHQNPTGSILPADRRRRMLALAKQYDTLIVDDHCYGDILFDPSLAVPSLYTLDEGESTVYVASFSKILGPGVRQGYFIAPDSISRRILAHKRDGGTNALASMILAEYFKDHLRSHIETITGVMKQKRDALLEALETHFSALGEGVEWTRPPGGFFVWVRVPEATDTRRALALAGERGIVYAPGQAFSAANEDAPYIRLAFGYPSIDDIREGVPLLAECLRAAQRTAAPV